MLALAGGQPFATIYDNDGAGEEIRTLDPNLGKREIWLNMQDMNV